MEKIEIFIKKSIDKFNYEFDYSKVVYINSSTKVDILCIKHNISFSQVPSEHLRGKVCCNLCKKNPEIDTEYFIKKSQKIYGYRYDYIESVYVNSWTKIKIMCVEHGIFEQLANQHYKQNCPKCSLLIRNKFKKLTNETFSLKANKKHNNFYDYSLVDIIDSKTKVKIVCPKHGIFEQTPSGHIRGKHCLKCAIEKTKSTLTYTKDEFVNKSNNKHKFKFDYSKVVFVNTHTKVKIICRKHGEFEQLPYDHIAGHGCISCTSSVSNAEKEIALFIKNNNIEIISSSRNIIPPNQIDIYIPSHKLAIEYNGLYWHSEEYVDKNYHLNKTLECEKLGIQLIHIFEDEWVYKQDIVKSRIKNILGLTSNKIFARKCIIKDLSPKESKEFLDNNHLQGGIYSSIKLGLFFNDELVSVMLFNKPRLGVGILFDGYELSRFCNKINTSVIGGADKLLKHFIKNHKPKQIVSYADKRWSQGDLYDKLGFKFSHNNKPNYYYIVNKKRKHRFGFRKEKLRNIGFDSPNKTEHQIMLDRKIYRIYDSGTKTYKLIL